MNDIETNGEREQSQAQPKHGIHTRTDQGIGLAKASEC